MALPPVLYDACDKQTSRVNSLSLVRYRGNDYSVAVAYGHREVWIRGYIHEVVIGCGGEGIQLRPFRWVAASISRRLRMPQYLLHGLARNTKPKSRFSLAQSL